jgi:hypothetical protein
MASASQKTLRILFTKTNRIILFRKIEINRNAMTRVKRPETSASNLSDCTVPQTRISWYETSQLFKYHIFRDKVLVFWKIINSLQEFGKCI